MVILLWAPEAPLSVLGLGMASQDMHLPPAAMKHLRGDENDRGKYTGRLSRG